MKVTFFGWWDDNDELITFACQVLEYQPEPVNHWNIVGQLEAKRERHAVLSIDPELLPCLKGCLSKLTKVGYLNISSTKIK